MLHMADFPYEHFCELLEEQRPFSLARYGDGEWKAIFGATGANCDQHPYTRKLQKELVETLTTNPDGAAFHYRGMQPLAVRRFEDRIIDWLRRHQLQDMGWIDADIFHRASSEGNLGRLVNALCSRDVIVAGPPHLLENLTLFPFRYVYVPPHRCHDGASQIYDGVCAELAKLSTSAVVSISASMAANGLVQRLVKTHGKRHTFLDLGSLWDPYAGVVSRKYHPVVLSRLNCMRQMESSLA